MSASEQPTPQPEKEAVLELLRREIAWQWRSEKLNRFYAHTAIWLAWLCMIAIVGARLHAGRNQAEDRRHYAAQGA